MAARLRLDRKARTAIWVLVAIALAIVALVARNAIVSLTPEKLAALDSAPSTDELLVIGGHSVLLKHGSAADRIAHWTHGSDEDNRAFEIDDRSFTPNSDQLTSEGSTRAVQISDVMKHLPLLQAEIVPLADDHGTGLLSQRMKRFRANLIADGVAPARVTLSHAHGAQQADRLADPAQLIVVLTG